MDTGTLGFWWWLTLCCWRKKKPSTSFPSSLTSISTALYTAFLKIVHSKEIASEYYFKWFCHDEVVPVIIIIFSLPHWHNIKLRSLTEGRKSIRIWWYACSWMRMLSYKMRHLRTISSKCERHHKLNRCHFHWLHPEKQHLNANLST